MFNRIAGALVALLLVALPIAANAQFADQRTYATAAAGGTANAITVAIPNVVGPPRGVLFKFIPAVANTGPTQLNINGTGLKNLLKTSGAGPVALVGGELQPLQIAGVIYDGTQYQLVTIPNAAAAAIVMPPQGYLTPCPQAVGATQPTGCTAGQLTPTGDVTVGSGQAVTGLVYTPVAGGNQAPVWNGSQFVNFTFQELTLTIPSSRLANLAYDVCLFNNSGSLAIGFTPAWSNSGVGAGNRGTGAGTPQIERKNGIYVNSVSVSVVNGGTTTVVAANQCTYVASVLMSGTNGVVTFTTAPGQSRIASIWNRYNKQLITLTVTDPTASWIYNTNTIRAANGNAANSMIVFSGLPEDIYTFQTIQRTLSNSGSGTAEANTGIGINSTTVFSGKIGAFNTSVATGPIAIAGMGDMVGSYSVLPQIGAHTVTMLENTPATGAGSQTYYGTISRMIMTGSWRG